MICSPRSFQGLSVALPHTHSLSTSTCSSPNATPWVTRSYLCTCSCPHLVPDFLPLLLDHLLSFLQIYPIALHTSRRHYSDYSVNDACWSCAALYKLSLQGLLPPKRKFFGFPQTASVRQDPSPAVSSTPCGQYRKAFPSPWTMGSLRVWQIQSHT